MKFPTYSAYKSLNIDWNRSAPIHWRQSKLKYDSYIKARVGWHGLKSEDFTETGPYLVTGSDFSGKLINWAKCYHCSLDRYEQDPYIQLKDNDLLITKDGTIGKVILTGILPDRATLNSGVFVLRPLKNAYLTKFYYWLMQSSVFQGFVEYYRTGSTILHLYQETFSNIPYALPTIEEQSQIANFLDHETAKIDTLIDTQQQLIKLLVEKRQAVISHAVTKGLNPDAKMKDSGVEWLGEVPEHWLTTSLKRLAAKLTDGEHISPTFTDEGMPFLSAKDVRDRKINFNVDKFVAVEDGNKFRKRCNPELDDILIVSRGATIGRVGLVEKAATFCLLGSVILLKLKAGIVDPVFVYYLLNQNAAKEQFYLASQASAQQAIYLVDVAQMSIVLPPLGEQIQIRNHLEIQVKKIEHLVNRAHLAVKLLQERRTALISAAVTGKIDVRDAA